jgi:3-hydroxyacyl-[acyl-carrier-protein] dehydratase
MTHLIKNFYTEISSDFNPENSSQFYSNIKLDPAHPVYKGHFEQVPIAPGVILTQIIKEILADKFQKDLRLRSADNIKFLVLINPNENREFTIKFSVTENEGLYSVSASYEANATTFLKFKGKFAEI